LNPRSLHVGRPAASGRGGALTRLVLSAAGPVQLWSPPPAAGAVVAGGDMFDDQCSLGSLVRQGGRRGRSAPGLLIETAASVRRIAYDGRRRVFWLDEIGHGRVPIGAGTGSLLCRRGDRPIRWCRDDESNRRRGADASPFAGRSSSVMRCPSPDEGRSLLVVEWSRRRCRRQSGPLDHSAVGRAHGVSASARTRGAVGNSTART
jgi:hypothetical protein